jgi:hypothetical protein
LPDATSPVSPADVVPVVQGGVTKKASLNELGFAPAGSGITRTIQSKLRDVVSALDYGADNTGVADSTNAIQLALNENNIVFIPAGRYRINGTLNVPLGGVMHGETNTGDYFPGHPGKDGTLLFKDSASSNGPIVRLKECSGIHHLQFDHQKINGGTDGIIGMDPVATTTYASMDNIYIMGHRTTDTTGATSCYGIKFDGSATTARVQFANRVSNYHITNCDIGVFLGGLANVNVFTNGITRECHVHYELKGNATHGCIENVFSGLTCYTIVTMSPLAICFKLTQYAAYNVFVGYTTEAYGFEFSEGVTGISNNLFLGQSNENASWTSQANLRYMQPENVSNFAKYFLASKTTNDRNVVGTGATYFEQFFIDGTMPEANNNAGTFQAADPDSKVIFRFNSTFTFLNFKSFGARLKVYVYGNSGSGMHVADVTFKYLVADSATPPYAAKLCVDQVFNNPSGGQITGLYFITGKTGGVPMGIGLVCGNFGAFQVVNIRCVLEYEVFDFATDSDFFTNYVGLSSKTTAAATANDVTDSITLLATGQTLI